MLHFFLLNLTEVSFWPNLTKNNTGGKILVNALPTLTNLTTEDVWTQALQEQ